MMHFQKETSFSLPQNWLLKEEANFLFEQEKDGLLV